MSVSISRLWWFGLLGLVWIGLPAEGQAWEPPFVKLSKVRVNFNVEFSTIPKGPQPKAPWYAYFPADPRLLPSPQASPYPPWPMQFPPQGPPSDALKDAQKRTGAANVPTGPMLTQHGPSYQTYGSSLQPVGYTPPQAPSYWYRNR